MEFNNSNTPLTYADVDRQLMIKYANKDVYLMLAFIANAYTKLQATKQEESFLKECQNIMPF